MKEEKCLFASFHMIWSRSMTPRTIRLFNIDLDAKLDCDDMAKPNHR